MKIKHLFDLKKIFIKICNLKYYISWNLISLIGYLDFLYCLHFYSVSIGSYRFSAGDIMLIFSVYYLIFTRIAFFIFLLCFNGIKIKQNKFIDNRVYNTFFLIGLICFSAVSLITLISIISVFVVILLFY